MFTTIGDYILPGLIFLASLFMLKIFIQETIQDFKQRKAKPNA